MKGDVDPTSLLLLILCGLCILSMSTIYMVHRAVIGFVNGAIVEL